MTNLMTIKQFSKILMVFVLATVSVVSQAKKETITFIHTDHLGSPIMATNEDGSVKWREDYQPFGKQLTNQDTDNNVGFTGHKDDKSLGLTYMQARWYHPEAGRFMSLDPIRYRDVHSFNRYVYANNNPYKYVDPDGKYAQYIGRQLSYKQRNLSDKEIVEKESKIVDIQLKGIQEAVSMSGLGLALDVIIIVNEEKNGENTTDNIAGAGIGKMAEKVVEGLIDTKYKKLKPYADLLKTAAGKVVGDTTKHYLEQTINKDLKHQSQKVDNDKKEKIN